jgi:hypothetical protein
LTGSAGLWPPDTPGFAALASSALGNAGSPADQTEARIQALFTALDAAGRLTDVITRAGVDLAGAVARADAIKLGDLDAAIAAASAAGGPSLGKVGAALTLLDAAGSWAAAAPLPPAAPVPTVASEGGAQGGGVGGTLSGPVDSVILASGAAAAVHSMVTAGILTGALATALPIVIPIVGAAVAVVLLALHFIGHGCGAPCIDGSKAEQIYEAAADNLYQAYKLGMLTAAEAIAGMAYLISAGTHHLQTFGTDAANRGIGNMTNTIHAEVRDVQVTAAPKPQPVNLAKLHLDYVQGPGWYADSLTAAAQLSDTLVKELSAKKAG